MQLNTNLSMRFFWYSLVKKVSRKVTVYYGALGHNKGLVDAMTAYGAKNPIQRAVWIEKNLIQESCFL